MRPSLLILALLGMTAGRDEALAQPWTTPHPTDAPKRHVETIAVGRHVYVVRQGGTMDGTNCRSPIGVGMSDGPAIEQTWESNRAVRLENTGDTDVINPWLSNGVFVVIVMALSGFGLLEFYGLLEKRGLVCFRGWRSQESRGASACDRVRRHKPVFQTARLRNCGPPSQKPRARGPSCRSQQRSHQRPKRGLTRR